MEKCDVHKLRKEVSCGLVGITSVYKTRFLVAIQMDIQVKSVCVLVFVPKK